jgi:hypothetical protein
MASRNSNIGSPLGSLFREVQSGHYVVYNAVSQIDDVKVLYAVLANVPVNVISQVDSEIAGGKTLSQLVSGE